MSTRFTALFLSAFLYTTLAHAVIDMRNANFSDSWIFLQVDGTGYDLKYQGSYNSRTLYSGMLGFGWCTDYETTLKITAESSLRVTECGAGFEVEYHAANYSSGDINANVTKIMAEVKLRNKGRPPEYFNNLEKEIRDDSSLRDEFAKQLNLDGKVKENTKYVADGRANDFIILKGGEYTRNLANGSTQKFSKSGQLLQITDRNNNFIKITYKGDKIASIHDNSGSSLQIKYHDNSKFVKSVNGPNGLMATFKFKGENLIESMNAGKKSFKYQYDDLNNLTKVSYPDNTAIALTYDKDKDWVTSYSDRRGCKESYKYKDNEKDPANNYTSTVEKVCEGKITNNSSYEFWHNTKKDGSKFLSRTKSVVNGKVVETIYHEVYGKPVEINDEGAISRFDYYQTGQLKRKTSTASTFNYKYESACNKVSQVIVAVNIPKAVNPKDRKPSKLETKTFTSDFRYDSKRCNLMAAKNSSGQSVQLEYDIRGRIARIVDQSKKEVSITYEERFGKPHIVSRPGLGTIKFKYKADGTMEKLDSDDDPIVASQVLNVFSNMLEIIAPATTETNNI